MKEQKEKRAVSRMISTNAMAIACDYAQKVVQEKIPFNTLWMVKRKC